MKEKKQKSIIGKITRNIVGIVVSVSVIYIAITLFSDRDMKDVSKDTEVKNEDQISAEVEDKNENDYSILSEFDDSETTETLNIDDSEDISEEDPEDSVVMLNAMNIREFVRDPNNIGKGVEFDGEYYSTVNLADYGQPEDNVYTIIVRDPDYPDMDVLVEEYIGPLGPATLFQGDLVIISGEFVGLQEKGTFKGYPRFRADYIELMDP